MIMIKIVTLQNFQIFPLSDGKNSIINTIKIKLERMRIKVETQDIFQLKKKKNAMLDILEISIQMLKKQTNINPIYFGDLVFGYLGMPMKHSQKIILKFI